ncbi:maleylpyruvate isomerase N-terminal domain-containing protein [Nocardioides houyundeii]|uniref:maleylpyruvate isomerase N-terminal domain-containing protein n=1 Tax=Nocardioides houyundeii TaxID=2045452 RepID=UPI000C78F48A|nr:maleylpyruvate isomerase N-terminal domain-containing protein [Nocardioides houyundeii]
MPLSFAGTLDRSLVPRAADALAPLVRAPEVENAWHLESALPGMTVGGVARHLVSQPECAVEFLRAETPRDANPLSLKDYFDRVDWLGAPVDAVENTSIRDDFNAMAQAGHADSVAVLDRSRDDLPAAIAAAGPTTYVPWQGCALALDDFLAVRLMELVVHADDLATSVGRPTPVFGDEVDEVVAALLASLSLRRHGFQVVRALSRAERSSGSVSAF